MDQNGSMSFTLDQIGSNLIELDQIVRSIFEAWKYFEYSFEQSGTKSFLVLIDIMGSLENVLQQSWFLTKS